MVATRMTTDQTMAKRSSGRFSRRARRASTVSPAGMRRRPTLKLCHASAGSQAPISRMAAAVMSCPKNVTSPFVIVLPTAERLRKATAATASAASAARYSRRLPRRATETPARRAVAPIRRR